MNLSRLSSPFREFGVGAGLVYVLDRLLHKLSARAGLYLYELVEQPVQGQVLLPPAHAQHVRFVELQPGAEQLSQVPRPAAVVADRFGQGAVCLAVYMKDRYVGYAWFAFDRYEEDEVRCTYQLQRPAQSAFDFDVYVFPAYRLGRAFAAVWHASNQYLAGRGVTRTCSRIAASNVASRRSHAQLGAREVGRALFLSLGSWQLTWSTALAFPCLHVGSRGRPTLKL
jgi:hypothetical protein